MLQRLQRFFEARVVEDRDEQGRHGGHTLRLAAAVLLVEMTRADFEVSPEERTAVLEALRRAFALPEEELKELRQLAEDEARTAISLHPFTDRINSDYDAGEKRELICLLWRVAYADGRVDKYEDYLVRKVAELLYVPHRDFIRCKHEAKAEIDAGPGLRPAPPP